MLALKRGALASAVLLGMAMVLSSCTADVTSPTRELKAKRDQVVCPGGWNGDTCNGGVVICTDETAALMESCEHPQYPDICEIVGGCSGGGGGSPQSPQKAVRLTCDVATPTRAATVRCTAAAEPSGSSLSISQWSFSPDSTNLGFVTGDVTSIEWSGPIVASGYVVVEALVAGEAKTDSVHLTVTPRTWSGGIPDSIVDIPTTFSADPDSASQLGQTEFDIDLPASIVKQVPSGPNKDYHYLSSVPTYLALIAINTPAMTPGSAFYNRHPISAGQYCARSFVSQSLPGLVRVHEGRNREQGSHTQRYFAYLSSNRSSIRVAAEQIVSDFSGLSRSTVVNRLKPFSSAALTASKVADTQNRIMLPNCSLVYHP